MRTGCRRLIWAMALVLGGPMVTAAENSELRTFAVKKQRNLHLCDFDLKVAKPGAIRVTW